MKLTIALALLACAPIGDSQALKINDGPEKKINAYDTTQLDDLSTAEIDSDVKTQVKAKEEVKAVAKTESDPKVTAESEIDADIDDDQDIDYEQLYAQLDKGDIADLLQDPTELIDALQEGVDSDADAVDAKEDNDMLNEY